VYETILKELQSAGASGRVVHAKGNYTETLMQAATKELL